MGVGSVDVPLSPIKESMFLKQQHRVLHRGTTLIELVVAIMLMALVMGTVLPVIASLRHNSDLAQNSMDALQKGRSLFNHLSLHLGQAIRITDVSPASQTLGYIEFEDDLGGTYRYDVGADTYVEYGLSASQENLAGPVSQLQFTCYSHYDMNSPITDVNSIRFVEVQATIINQGTTGQDKTFSTSAYVYVNGNNNETQSSMGAPLEFENSHAGNPALAGIDSTHYLCAYRGPVAAGRAEVLQVNSSDWSIAQGAAYEFDAVQAKRPALAQINGTQYLCAYQGPGDDGWATVLTVDNTTWAVTQGDSLEFDPTQGKAPGLARIDSTHYLCAYQGLSDKGWAVVLSTDAGLLGHWKFDETTGTTAADASGNGNHGTLTDMAGNEWTTGIVDGALDFDGTDDRVACGSFDVAGGDNHISIAAWFRADDVSNAARIVAKASGSSLDEHYWALMSTGSRLWFCIRTDGSTTAQEASSGDLSPGVWTHAAATWDGSTMRIYKDGVLVGSQSQSGTLNTDPSAGVALGNEPPGISDKPFDGLLDDVRIYSRALDATEIASLATTLRYQAGTEAKAGTDTTSITASTPPATSAGDLLVAAVATDGDTSLSLAPPGGQGWTQVSLNDYMNEVTLGTWWKLAGASEPGSHQFTWSGAEQAYAWIMRFTGHDPADPIDVFGTSGTNSSSPSSPAVTTSVDNALILRLGAFDGSDITVDAPGLNGHTAITMDSSSGGGGGGQVTYEAFTEAKRTSEATSVTVNTPFGASTGDLLICAVVTRTDNKASLSPPVGQGWNQISLENYGSAVTLGVWWKLAGASEAPSHQFTWSNPSEAYAWMMHFTGHDPGAPIHAWAHFGGDRTSTPDCPAVTTTQADCMILRIGGFAKHDVTVDDPGLSGHTAVTMDRSSTTGTKTCSGGAGYQQQAAPGSSGVSEFSLTMNRKYRTVTLALAPALGAPSDPVSGGGGYVTQSASGPSGTSSFSLSAAEQARTVTLALKPQFIEASSGSTVTLLQGTPFEFASGRGIAPALAQIDGTHYLCAHEGPESRGRVAVLTVNPSNWSISKESHQAFDSVRGLRPALVQIDATHYLCAYQGPGDDGWAVILTVNTSTWTVSSGTPFEFDTVKGLEPALAQIDSTRYLCAYRGALDDGWSTVLIVDPGTWTVSQGTPFEFDTVMGQQPALIQVDPDHYLCTHSGDSDDGWSVVLAPNVTQVLP